MIVDGRQKKNLDQAVKLINDGDVVAFPTETVYGLGADTFNKQAIEKIFKIKKRPLWDPLIVHIADADQLRALTNEVSSVAQTLIKNFWPGPLTILFEKKTEVPDVVTAGLKTVAIRMPRNLVALALIKNSRKPIAAPSANKFQSLSPTTAQAVEKELGRDILILDGGSCEVGLESTVISLEDDQPKILRPGGITKEQIETVLKTSVEVVSVKNKITAPGMDEFHYAPGKKLKLYNVKSLSEHLSKRGSKNKIKNSALVCFSKHQAKDFEKMGFGKIFILSIRGNLTEAAKNFYQTLRDIDEGEWSDIMALECSDEMLGLALNDRLKRAQHESQ